MQNEENRRKTILSSIKSTVAQLECWDRDQAGLARRRAAANARFPGGFADRQAFNFFQASRPLFEFSNGRQSDLNLQEPHCNFCDSNKHETEECSIRDTCAIQEICPEDPARGIHRAIVHRLYLQACDLYRRSYPRFYPGPEERNPAPEDIYPVPLTGPDYLVLAINQTASEVQTIPEFYASLALSRNRQTALNFVGGLYYSKTFPLSFLEFLDRVVDKVEQDLEEASGDEA